MKIAIVDTYYPEAIRAIPFDERSNYETELRRVLDFGFGTGDSYSHNLKPLGWEGIDIIANHFRLQQLWARENHSISGALVAYEQIRRFDPAVVFMQDLSFFPADILAELRRRYVLAGQCSCPMPPEKNIGQFDVIFTSFPFYVEEFKRMGVPGAEYLPLAFDPRMRPRDKRDKRDIEISFVGGVGKNSHWQEGTAQLEAVAARFGERFHWYGYGLDNLAKDSPLRACYRGKAWGRDMYAVYGRSKIVVNRHGEVARGFENNLRMYEAAGCGALVMELSRYSLEEIEQFLIPSHRPTLDAAAQRIEASVLNHHTYAHRMPLVSEVLMECLKGAPA